LFEECTFQEECQNITESICSIQAEESIGKCICNTNSLPGPDDEVCLPFATKLEDPCYDVGHCKNVENAICGENRECSCSAYFVPHPDGTSCLPVREYIWY